jgi:hypothetical protein
MPRPRTTSGQEPVGDYRHDAARRVNNPPAGIAPTYRRCGRFTTKSSA